MMACGRQIKKRICRKRVSLMNEQGCLLAVSIHQNSFTEEKYRGAQVFYYGPSERKPESLQRLSSRH
ncbi:MAG: N-acetylmuramoyl-L-alanine amidase [Coprococcus sp.]